MTADEFKALRARSGLSQGGLADKLGLSRPTIARYESGEREIPGDIADLLDTLARSDTAEPDTIVSKPAPIVSSVLDLSKLTPWTIPAGLEKRTLPVMPGWQVCGHRVVHDTIPDPIPYDAPTWAGWRGILTSSGRVYDYETGKPMKPLNFGPRPDGPAPGSRQIDKTYKRRAA